MCAFLGRGRTQHGSSWGRSRAIVPRHALRRSGGVRSSLRVTASGGLFFPQRSPYIGGSAAYCAVCAGEETSPPPSGCACALGALGLRRSAPGGTWGGGGVICLGERVVPRVATCCSVRWGQGGGKRTPIVRQPRFSCDSAPHMHSAEDTAGRTRAQVAVGQGSAAGQDARLSPQDCVGGRLESILRTERLGRGGRTERTVCPVDHRLRSSGNATSAPRVRAARAPRSRHRVPGRCDWRLAAVGGRASVTAAARGVVLERMMAGRVDRGPRSSSAGGPAGRTWARRRRQWQR
jgi:hypothetical protein